MSDTTTTTSSPASNDTLAAVATPPDAAQITPERRSLWKDLRGRVDPSNATARRTDEINYKRIQEKVEDAVKQGGYGVVGPVVLTQQLADSLASLLSNSYPGVQTSLELIGTNDENPRENRYFLSVFW